MPPSDDGEENGSLNYIMIGGILAGVGVLVGGTAYLCISAKTKPEDEVFGLEQVYSVGSEKATEMRIT